MSTQHAAGWTRRAFLSGLTLVETAGLLGLRPGPVAAEPPPEPQDLRTRKIGHILVNSNVDRPWSRYFCCMVAAHRPFVQQHPIATKRALRAILKGTDVCAV
jgi:hypothetical protein